MHFRCIERRELLVRIVNQTTAAPHSAVHIPTVRSRCSRLQSTELLLQLVKWCYITSLGTTACCSPQHRVASLVTCCVVSSKLNVISQVCRVTFHRLASTSSPAARQMLSIVTEHETLQPAFLSLQPAFDRQTGCISTVFCTPRQLNRRRRRQVRCLSVILAVHCTSSCTCFINARYFPSTQYSSSPSRPTTHHSPTSSLKIPPYPHQNKKRSSPFSRMP